MTNNRNYSVSKWTSTAVVALVLTVLSTIAVPLLRTERNYVVIQNDESEAVRIQIRWAKNNVVASHVTPGQLKVLRFRRSWDGAKLDLELEDSRKTQQVALSATRRWGATCVIVIRDNHTVAVSWNSLPSGLIKGTDAVREYSW